MEGREVWRVRRVVGKAGWGVLGSGIRGVSG